MVMPVTELTFVSLDGNLHVSERQTTDNLMVATQQFLTSWIRRAH
jgi:hypothetical protein